MWRQAETLINKEARTVLLLCKVEPSEYEIEEANLLLGAPDFHFIQFLAYLMEHKVTMIVYRNLLAHSLHRHIPPKYMHMIDLFASGMEERNQVLDDQLMPLFRLIQDRGITALLLKGAVLRHTVYPSPGLRFSNDTDLLVQEKDLQSICKLLVELGFIQGFFSYKTGVEPAKRQEVITKRMVTHEVVPFLKEVHHPMCKVVQVDINFDIFNRAKRMRTGFDTAALFESVIPSSSVLASLRHEYNILQLSSHLYQDAAMVQGIRAHKDMELIKYVDIYEYIRKFGSSIDWDWLRSEIVQAGLQSVVFYALYHMEYLLGSIVPASFMNSIAPDDKAYLDYYGVEEEKPIRWKKTFLERMFDSRRKLELLDVDKKELSESSKYFDIF
ncbi:nucleotidyltransferase family protein [Paenibacillus xylaniclasticus]|uniref:nucleotidyltransferase family protein n=1 Tax=Paenibacillus xylaniclasticus TaxID=588083 RepID=UPI000FD8C7A2|nr:MULTISPECIES: nucleotidyltransferase family protein [Paenibacillus]GFN32226.1 hypothetical protein PCURB6_24860 [Paenibacillus curdlanolyticus]